MLRSLIYSTARSRFPISKHSLHASTSIRSMSYPFPAKKRMTQVQQHLTRDISSTSSASGSSQSGIASTGPNGKKRTGGGDTGDEPKVLSLLEGNTTTILLNRPRAINALDDEMIQLIEEALDSTPPHTHIVLRGNGKGLCAGGDVMSVVTRANSKDPAERQKALIFFKDEFELDYKIATLDQAKVPRVFISIMDGLTLGGGVGLSVHAPIRVSTEKTRFSMPETGIGYFPDVGVTRFLSRLDGRIGHYLGMTGVHISGEEVYLAGLSTHYISSSSIPSTLHRLSSMPPNATAAQLSQTLDDHSINPFDKNANSRADEILSKSCFIGETRIALDYAFGQPTVEEVYACVKEIANGEKNSQTAQKLAGLGLGEISESTQDWAEETMKALDMKSPRSLKVTLLAINEARRLDLAEAFRFDMRLATAFCDLSIGRDFFEGVTHVLTKDPETKKKREGRAKWDPASLDKVKEDSVKALFFGPVAEAQRQGLSIDVPVLDKVPTEQRDRAAQRQKDDKTRGLGPLHWEKEHNVWALPSEAECEALREGSHLAAGNYEMTEEEMISTLLKVKGERPGLEFKVKEWLQRRQMMQRK